MATFNQITPENKADIVRTQIQRWTDVNRARLTPEQTQFMKDMLAFVTADLYRQPQSDALMARAKDLEARALALFAKEDIAQAATLEAASYIPKPQ
jgi:hypothetical protein